MVSGIILGFGEGEMNRLISIHYNTSTRALSLSRFTQAYGYKYHADKLHDRYNKDNQGSNLKLPQMLSVAREHLELPKAEECSPRKPSCLNPQFIKGDPGVEGVVGALLSWCVGVVGSGLLVSCSLGGIALLLICVLCGTKEKPPLE